MKARDLIEKLQALAPETEVIVWEGYDAGCATGDFELFSDTFSDTKEPFVRLDGTWL
jgi:hypothetical protein